MRKFKGIKKAITETKKLNGFNGKVEINYNIEKDTVSCKFFAEYDYSNCCTIDGVAISDYFEPATIKEVKADLMKAMNHVVR